MDNQSKLYGKTIIWNGDSICAGKAFDDSRDDDAWAGRIAKRNLMIYKNYAVGGGTITENVMFASKGKLRHSVSATLDTMYEEYPDADYVIIEGGTNDADLLGNFIRGTDTARFGVFDPCDFGGEYDKDTFSGALESVFFRATRYWSGKKIAFIVAHKMGANLGGFTSETNNRRIYFERAIEICKKWGIPYLDLWERSYLNPKLKWMYDNEKTPDENVALGSFYADGQHLTAKGYELTADIIDSWIKTL
jgi:lysophospholipase L1-like esterase